MVQTTVHLLAWLFGPPYHHPRTPRHNHSSLQESPSPLFRVLNWVVESVVVLVVEWSVLGFNWHTIGDRIVGPIIQLAGTRQVVA